MMAYVYKWTHIPTLKWYVGSHSGRKKNYICSSRIVKPLIHANPLEWQREIIAHGTLEEMVVLEKEILQLFDAMHDPRSYNLHNNAGVNTLLCQTPEARAKRRAALKGVPKTEAHRLAVSQSKMGHIHTPETKAKLSAAMKGKPWSAARRAAYNIKKET